MNLRNLPKWQQYAIALPVVTGVVCLARLTGGDKGPPSWLTQWLIPILAWVYIVAGAVALVRFALRRRPDPTKRVPKR